MIPQHLEQEVEETPINMAALFYISLDKMNTAADEAYLSNDLSGWYKGLNRVFKRVIIKTNPTETDKLKGQFEKAKVLLTEGHREEEAAEVLNQIDLDLMLAMKKYGMIMPQGKMMGWQKVKARFQLDEQTG